MSYDATSESRALIASGSPQAGQPISRRHRFAPLAVDVHGDIAATLFLRRGVNGETWLDTWVLEQRDGQWFLLGGGSGNGADDFLTDRRPAEQLGGLLQAPARGGVRRRTSRWWVGAARVVSYANLLVATEVERLHIGGREVPVPDHGHVVVVWATRTAPEVTGLDAEGAPLATLAL
jgi:hypothetical protein